MRDFIRSLGTWKFWKELLIMTFGMLVAAAAVYYFLMPSKLVVGSITGLSIVIGNLLAAAGIGIKVSQVIVIINAILLILAWILIGHEFGAKTVYTALILGPLVDFWEKVLPIESLLEAGQSSLMNDPWFDLLCFVLILSASQSTVSVAGALICCTAFAINPFRLVVIGLIGTWINGLALDYFTASINRKKRVCVISREYEIIREYIINELHRGCTLYPIKRGFSLNDSFEIQTLLTQNEFADLLSFMKSKEIDAFITAGNVSEIYGRWNPARRH